MRLITVVILAICAAQIVYAADSCQAIFGRGVSVVDEGRHVRVFLPTGESLFMTLASGKPAKDSALRFAGGIQIPDSDDPDINCHGYACYESGIPGLPAGWIEGRPSQKILRAFFHPTDKPVDGDLVVFHNEFQVLHTGIVVTNNGSMWVRSKFGDESTWLLPIDTVSRYFQSDRLEFWRKN